MTMAMVNPHQISAHDFSKHQHLIYQLRQAGGARNEQLANRLASCAPFHPCMSGACIRCRRKLQLAIAALIEREIREPARRAIRDRMSMATIIPAAGIVAPDGLTGEVCRRVIADLATAICACSLSPSVWGIDVSFNEDQEGRLRPHWVVHGHGAFSDWLSDNEKAALRGAVAKSPFVCKRVHVVELDGRANAPLYAVKPDRVRKVGYLDNSKVAQGRKPFRNTHRRDLRPWQAVALAQVEHELGLANRLIITGIAQDAVRTALKGLYWPQDGP